MLNPDQVLRKKNSQSAGTRTSGPGLRVQTDCDLGQSRWGHRKKKVFLLAPDQAVKVGKSRPTATSGDPAGDTGRKKVNLLAPDQAGKT